MSEPEIKNLYAVFKIDSDLFAVPASKVLYIMSSSDYNNRIAFPNMPRYVKGIIEAGGTLITVVDLNGNIEKTACADNLIVVIKYDNQNIGVPVDEVQLITVLDGDHFSDNNMGLNFFRHNGNTYSILDEQVIGRMLSNKMNE